MEVLRKEIELLKLKLELVQVKMRAQEPGCSDGNRSRHGS
jgi:hypothetical protein